MYYPAEVQVTPLTTVRRERVLPVPGEILVSVGDRVEPRQIVAHTELTGDFRIVPVARLLGISTSKTKRYLRIKPGDEVKRGQTIARKGYLPARTVKSPINGIIKASGGGRVLIEAPSTPFELFAYINGTVVNVLEPHGLIIETTGAVIQGMWGGGGGSRGENLGIIKCVVTSPDQALRAQNLDLSCRGMILVGGARLSEAVLEQAQELQVGGIVVGGISPELIPQIEQSPLPIVATEGIGTVPMAEPIFRLLTTNDGREASISARVQPRWPIVRPEIIIPLPANTLPASQTQMGEPLTVGTQVRAVRAPYMGAVGQIVMLPEQARRTETGGKALCAKVDLGQDTPIFIPLANLEVLR
ncbi:MAG: hypothetical protein GY832_10415 [Chloroflexi bacterium]|nr:hypothetical protein [Chloroflexota bacterium]